MAENENKYERTSFIEKKMEELGIKIPELAPPVASYIPGIKDGNHIYTSGQIPLVEGKLVYEGHAGGECSPEDAYQAARICVLNCLAVVKDLVGGDLERVEQIVKITGFVSSAPGFYGQSQVINGASDLMEQLFAERGAHTRSAVGVYALPLNAPVEIEMIVSVKESRRQAYVTALR